MPRTGFVQALDLWRPRGIGPCVTSKFWSHVSHAPSSCRAIATLGDHHKPVLCNVLSPRANVTETYGNIDSILVEGPER